ncbi:MAG: hypothetical protein M3R48_01200 [Candidatus Dormibacteraeota bacterium]|nr:hypothetical protein [Candidatus Dormibacteraeota bacterium]
MTARGRVLDWAWRHPRSKRLMREAWGVSREAAAAVGAPRPFDPPEFSQLRHLAMAAPVPAADAPRVLFMSWRGWSTHLAIETVLAHAVARRGAAPVFATCGGRLPICDVMAVDAAPPMPCHSCREYAFGALRAAGFDALALHDVLDVRTAVERAKARTAPLHSVLECEEFTADGLPLGRLVRVSVAWFLSRGTLPETRQVLDTYRAFLASAIVVASGLRTLLDRVQPDRVFMLNGTFFAESIMWALADARGIPFTTYEKGFVYDSIVMTPGQPACYLMVPEADWTAARDVPLREDEVSAIDAYLGQREEGGGTLDNFWRDRVDDAARIRTQLRLVPGRPLVVMFCNILWDSAVLGKDIAFASMGDWVLEGIAWARAHPEADLVIRIHPAEVKLLNHPTRERTADLIAARVPSLPANVRVVAADDPTSSYALMDEAALGLVYTSTVGLEMAARGSAVVVAADTHYRGRGFTLDPTTPAEYWATADRVLASPPDRSESDRIRDLSRRYAVLFFFRFHQVLDAVHEEGRSRPVVRAEGVNLNPGHSAVIDRLVAGILDGTSVVAPHRTATTPGSE